MARKSTRDQTPTVEAPEESPQPPRREAMRLVPPVAGDADDATARQAVLEQRLEDGYQRIDRAIRAGEDVQRWEDFWMGLLHEYEALCQRLDRAA